MIYFIFPSSTIHRYREAMKGGSTIPGDTTTDDTDQFDNTAGTSSHDGAFSAQPIVVATDGHDSTLVSWRSRRMLFLYRGFECVGLVFCFYGDVFE
jgi:hypothetical protein